jgi:hypothetical protein
VAADEGRKVIPQDEQASDLLGLRVRPDGSVSVRSCLLEQLAWRPAAVPPVLTLPARLA